MLLVVLGVVLPQGPASAAPEDQLVLVLDSSGSMAERVGGRPKIDIAKESLTGVVGDLDDEARVGLRVYGAEVFDRSEPGACTDSQLVVPIGTDNRPDLRREIRGYEPFGETPISYSLRQAAEDLGTEGKRTILLVSDGEETCNTDPCATAAALAETDIEVKIDVVGLAVSGSTREQLRCVAERGNGTYYDADSVDDLTSSLDTLATRAFRPFRLTGTPVAGASDPAEAPVLQPGQYVDTFGLREEPLTYRLPRSEVGSTLRAGLTTQAAGSVSGASVRFRDAEGSECSSDLALGVATGGARPLVTGENSSWHSSPDDPCNAEDELLVEVVNLSNELAGTPFELLLSEEPPVEGIDGLPPLEEEVRWTPLRRTAPQEPPVAGSSLSDAPELAPGTYRTEILTGESQVFAVPTDWGQRLQVSATVPPRRGALAEAVDRFSVLNLQLLGAGRGAYDDRDLSGAPEPIIGPLDEEAYEVVGSTPTIRYLNRTSTGSEAYAAVPGSQYIVLNMDSVTDEAFLVPYVLQVELVGVAGEGAPTYVDGAELTPTATPTPSEEPTESADPEEPAAAAEDTSSDGGIPLALAFGIGGGGLLIGAVLAALVLRSRRRGPASP
jgi:Ca-activated chloride channel family protein